MIVMTGLLSHLLLLLSLLAALGTAILEPHLNTRLRQRDLHRHLLAHKDVGIARFAEQTLEDVQLASREGCALTALLARHLIGTVRRKRAREEACL